MLAIVLTAATTAQAQTPPPMSGPVAVEGAYAATPGPFDVAVRDLDLHDPARNKDLHVKVRYPRPKAKDGTLPERLPLVVFSHGLGGSCDAFSDLSAHWASLGYVVIHPTHADSARDRAKKGEAIDKDTLWRSIMDLQARENRVRDLAFILDSLDQIEAGLPDLQRDGKGRIDREHIAAAGHSAGAYTTQLITGMRIRTREQPQGASYADPRVKAGLIISGQGVNGLGITKDAWEKVAVPTLVITGSKDLASVGSETPQTRRHPFEYARGAAGGGPACFLLWIEGASHSSYAGKSGRSIGDKESATSDPKMIGEIVQCATTAFLDRYLRGNEAGQAWLTSDAPAKMSGGKAQIKSK
jgi:predicted dienelactone hydrolase